MDAVELALRLIDLVERDAGLPSQLRADISALRSLADRQPDLALSRLDASAKAYARASRHDSPADTLAKCVTLDVLWQHYVNDDVRDAFRDPIQYAAYVTNLAAADIEATLDAHLRRSGVLIPATHSWLVRFTDVEGLHGRELVTALELGSAVAPPLVMLVLPQDRLSAGGVVIRPPRATDAALGRHVQWRVTGLARGIPEYIDRDIPGSAVGSIRWRP